MLYEFYEKSRFCVAKIWCIWSKINLCENWTAEIQGNTLEMETHPNAKNRRGKNNFEMQKAKNNLQCCQLW